MSQPNPSAPEDVQSQRIYRSLRNAIIVGEYQPGDRLRVVDIAGRESASPGAVREALAALATEHLVVPLPQRGFRVAPLSRADMYDLFTTRAELEGELARRSVENGNETWLRDIEAAYEKMSANARSLTFNPGAAQDHEAFHRLLVGACRSVWSLRLFETVYTASERYRYFAAKHLTKDRDPDREHHEIVDAIIARDGEKVQDLCREHILRTRDLLNAHAPMDEEPASPAPARSAA